MKRKILKILIGGALTIFLIGCGSSVTKKYENALASLDSKDYTSSVSLLEEVLEKNPDNAEAKELLEIISNYQKALELSKEDKVEEAKILLEKLSKDYKNYSIKKDIEVLASTLDKKIDDKEIALVDDMFKKARILFEEGKYTECKEFLDLSVSPKVKSIRSMPENTSLAIASLYSDCDESLASIEEEKANVEVAVAAQEQTYSAPSNTSIYSGSSSNNNTSKPTQTPSPTPTPNPTPSPEPTPVVPDDESNPNTDGMKNINGFVYSVKDANHWEAQLQYKLACAGMYNKVRFNTPAGEMSAILYYQDDTEFQYETSYGQTYGGQYFGTYNGRVVFSIKEFSY